MPPDNIRVLYKNIFTESSWPPSQIDSTTRTPTFLASLAIAERANAFLIYKQASAPSSSDERKSKRSAANLLELEPVLENNLDGGP